MLMNNSIRISRLSIGAGTLDPLASSKSTTTVKKRPQHRSCQSPTNKDNQQQLLKLGQRVSVSSLCAIGTIKFIGGLSFKPGQWVGIELDIIGAGKNDGSIKGVRYFDCPAETGLFILANKVSPLKESGSCSSSSTTQSSVATPKKSLTSTRSTSTTTTTTNGQRRRTKTPSVSETNTTRRPRQRCESHDQQSTSPPSSSLKKATLSTSSSTKTPRTQPTVTSTLSTRKPTASKSTKSSTTTSTTTTTKNLNSSPSQRKSATPVLSSSRSSISHRQQQQPQTSKSTRRTMTPTTTTTTTTKKRNSTSSSSGTGKIGGPEPLRKSKSTSTRQVVTKEELNKMHILLEQSRQEKQRLSDEMNGKEAVWERLVTAKESYALKVQDMQVEITRLQDALHISQQKTAELLQQSNKVGRSSSPNSQSSATDRMMMATDLDQQNLRRIEKLDRLVREWQQDAQDSHQQMQQQQRTHAAQVDQLRRDLAERDQATATMEREFESAKQANSETIQHYESTMTQWTTNHNKALKFKDDEIDRLHQIIEELKACHFLLPPSPNNEEEDEEGAHLVNYGVTDLNKISSSSSSTTTTTTTTTAAAMDANNMYSSRRRLEQQLELTTLALDDLQQQHRTTTMENEQLRDKLAQMHAASNAAEQQFRQLQNELAVEINDKRLVMEERDAGIQNQLRMEDEHKDLAMTNTRLEHQLGQLTDRLEQLQGQLDVTQQAHDTMEKECSRLMDDIVDLEEQLQQEADDGGGGTDTLAVIRLKQQLVRQQQQFDQAETTHRAKVSQLHHDMSLLESLVEKKAFRITELEELYHAEQLQKRNKKSSISKQKKKRQQQQQQQQTLHRSCSGIIMPLSPISDTASSVVSDALSARLDSVASTGADDHSLYCEICEIHGHDVLGCTALMTSRHQQDLVKEMYCVNCEIFDVHATADCPNQDESF